MKKIILLATALLLMSSLFSCGGKKKGKGTIYGTWRTSARTQYIFQKDGTLINKDTRDDSLTEKGTFTLKGDIISIKGNPLLTRKFKVVSIDSELAKVKTIHNGKLQTGHYRWKRVQ